MGGSGALMQARQGAFIPVAPEETSGGGRAAGLERTRCAGRTLGGINRGFVGGMGLLTSEQLTGRATIAVARCLIFECAAIEKRPVALVIDRTVNGHIGHNALFLQRLHLLAIGVSGISHYVQTRRCQRLLGSFSHRLQRTVVSGLICDFVRNDDPTLAIDCSLYVVAGPMLPTHQTGLRLT